MNATATSKLGREIVHVGSVKIIERVDASTLAFRHTDNFSVFDVGPHPQQIPGMGKAVLRCSMASDRIAKTLGIRTCVLEQESDDTVLVREFATPKDRSLLFGETNAMVRIEWIDRSHVSGSLYRAFKSGKKMPTDFGFASNNYDTLPQEGTQLPYPQYEATTKWEDVDRPMYMKDTLEYAGIALQQWDTAWRVIAQLNGALSLAAKAAGFTRLDGKKEMAIGKQGEWVVIDAFGNPNEDRYALTHTLMPGRVDHHSKEWLRQIFIRNGYKAQLDEARRLGLPDPSYPMLSEEEMG